MEENKKKEQELVRSYLKALLLHMAAHSDSPAFELQEVLREVIDELHLEVKTALEKKSHLQLVSREPAEVGSQ